MVTGTAVARLPGSPQAESLGGDASQVCEHAPQLIQDLDRGSDDSGISRSALGLHCPASEGGRTKHTRLGRKPVFHTFGCSFRRTVTLPPFIPRSALAWWSHPGKALGMRPNARSSQLNQCRTFRDISVP